MAVSLLRRFAFLALALGAMTFLGEAGAAPLYNVINLGSSYPTFEQDPSGNYYGLVTRDGLTYAFDKTKVTIEPDGHPYMKKDDVGWGTHYATDTSTSSHFVEARNSFGSIGYQVVTDPRDAPGIVTSDSIEEGKIAWTLSVTQSPALDFNTSGQVVGRSSYPTSNSGDQWYATFSGLNFTSHPATANPATSTDNLNDYVASSIPLNLFMATKIDDLGRIIADGGDIYLLVPIGLSTDPVTAPEPTTFVILAGGISALGIRSARRRWVRVPVQKA